MTRTLRDIQPVADCAECGKQYRRRIFRERPTVAAIDLCGECRPRTRAMRRTRREPMSEREKQIRAWLKTLTANELHLLKSKWIHDEQLKRRGIAITPKEGK